MPDLAAAGYDDSNRAFLQTFFAHSVLTLDLAKPILAAIFSVQADRNVPPDVVTLEDFQSYISAANAAISPLDLEIRSTVHQQTRERYWALVNTTSDALTQLATTYSAEEIAYVKRVLDGMFDGQNNKGRREAMCVSGIEAVQLSKPSNRRDTQNGASQAAGQGLSMRDAESMLSKLVDEGWFEKSVKGFYSLSPRALMELKGWLVDTYNEPADEENGEQAKLKIKFCHACKEIITVGQRCSQRECPCRLHDICTQQFFRVQRSQNCPLCQTAWDDKCYVGEKAITTSESYLRGKRRSTNKRAPTPNMDAGGDQEDAG